MPPPKRWKRSAAWPMKHSWRSAMRSWHRPKRNWPSSGKAPGSCSGKWICLGVSEGLLSGLLGRRGKRMRAGGDKEGPRDNGGTLRWYQTVRMIRLIAFPNTTYERRSNSSSSLVSSGWMATGSGSGQANTL